MMEALAARAAIERLPLSPAARLTGAPPSRRLARAINKVFAGLPWDPVLRDCLCAISGPGLCVYVSGARSQYVSREGCTFRETIFEV